MHKELGKFLRWWKSELYSLSPPFIRSSVFPRPRVLNFLYEKSQIKCQISGEHNELGLTPVEAETLGDAIAYLDSSNLQLPSKARISFSNSLFLHQNVKLPHIATKNLHESLSYQIDSLTPFKYEDIHLFCGLKDVKTQGNQITAWFVAIPKDIFKAALGVIPEDVALVEESVSHAPPEQDVFHISYTLKSRKEALLSVKNLALLLLIVIAMSGTLHIKNIMNDRSMLESQVDVLKKQAYEISSISHEIEKYSRITAAINQKIKGQGHFIDLIADITKSLDDNTWLTQISIENKKLKLTGYSRNVSSIISQVNKSQYIENAYFSSPTVHDRTMNSDRFSLSASLVISGNGL